MGPRSPFAWSVTLYIYMQWAVQLPNFFPSWLVYFLHPVICIKLHPFQKNTLPFWNTCSWFKPIPGSLEECRSQASSFSITCELVRNVNIQPSLLPQASINLGCHRISRWLWCSLNFENHCFNLQTMAWVKW